ncbi:hypothetical protein [Streptomyces sp. NPDC048710]|uniref:hypothetical protein n=1 Tax=Streptomyces sp. NPDC048710 TaxID=3365586 RepID=UPI003720B1B4
MSEGFLPVIPTDPHRQPEPETGERAAALVRQLVSGVPGAVLGHPVRQILAWIRLVRASVRGPEIRKKVRERIEPVPFVVRIVE